MLFSNPLEAYLNKTGKRDIPNFDGCHNTANWRGYIAWWELRKDSLFLLKITNCAYGDQPEELADLQLLFPDRLTERPIFADWLSGDLFNPYGKRLHYEHMGYASIYEKERVFSFEKGQMTAIQNFQNKVYKSSLSENTDSLHQFLYQNIRWKNLPYLQKGERPKVIVQFKTDENGTIQTPKIVRSSGSVYETEALRILNQIGQWNAYVQRGKPLGYIWTLPIVFDQAVYQKKLE